MNLSSNQKYILRILSSSEIYGSFKFSKLIYLLQSLGSDVSYEYKRGDYGPISSLFLEDLKALENLSLINREFDLGLNSHKFSISKQGKFLIRNLDVSIKELSLIQYWNTLTKDQAIKVLYQLCNVSEYEIGDFMPLIIKEKVFVTFFN